MTAKELDRLPFRSFTHLSKADEYVCTYVNDWHQIYRCVHVPKDLKHKTYTHYKYDGKVYKTRREFLKAIKDL